MTANKMRYFKHIFAGSERIATKQGNGFVALPSLAVQSNGAGTGDSIQTNADLPLSEAPLVPVVSHQVGWQAYIQGLGACASGTNNSFTLIGNLNFNGTTNVHLRNLQNTAEEDRINYYHPDHLGSTGYLTLSGKNSNGSFVRVTRHYQYLPFGENFIEQSNLAGQYQNPYEFNGKEKDIETGYNYYGARHYNSSWGVWLGVDPLAAEMPEWSPYNYTFNNPIRFIDPDGPAPVDCPSCWQRFWGGVQFLGGLAEGVGGTALLVTPEPTIATKVAGWGLVIHGSDMMSTGLRQLWTGKSEMSLTQQGLMGIGLSENQAMIVDASLGIAAGGAGAYAKVDKMLKMGAVTRNSYHDGLGALRKTADEMISNGYSYEEVVKQMVPARNNLKGMVRLADDGFNKGIAEIRNYLKYGNKLGPSIDDVIKKHTTNNKMDWKAAFDDIWETSKDFDKFK